MRARNSCVLAVAALAVLGLASSVSATVVYDDFDSGSLNPAKWTVQDYGGSTSQALSEVAIHANDGGFYEIDSTSEWGQGTKFTMTIGSANPLDSPHLSQIGLYGAGTGTPRMTIDDTDSLGRWMFNVSGAGLSTYTCGIDAPQAGDVYDILWTADAVELRRNGIVNYVRDTTVVPMGVAHFALASWGTAGDLKIAAVATGAVPEPSTLLLLATGAISLLAYAWRKRK